MTHIPRSCRREGHGPTTHLRRRVWWAPWRRRVITACWVCHTPLSIEEAAAAGERWAKAFRFGTGEPA